MTTNITIREAERQELSEVEALVKLAYKEFREYFPETAWSAWMNDIGQTVHAEAGLVLVATESEKIRGVVKFYPEAAEARLGNWPSGTASMRILAVHPACRGRGLGTLLVQECIRRARELGISALYLYTDTFMQAARQLYESMSFHRVTEYDREPGTIAYVLDL